MQHAWRDKILGKLQKKKTLADADADKRIILKLQSVREPNGFIWLGMVSTGY